MMEEILATTLYDDDFLTKSMNTNSLYDKTALDLSFTDNNNCSEQKVSCDVNLLSSDSNFLLATGDQASSNLDFLKLTSPDLEQIFMNMESGNDLLSNEAITLSPSKPSNSSSFDMDEDLIGAECYLTDALQHLHDKQTSQPVNAVGLLDGSIKLEEEDTSVTCLPTTHQSSEKDSLQSSSSLLPRQRKQYGVKLNLQKTLAMPQLNNVRNDSFNHKENCRSLLIHQHQPQHQQEIQQREEQQQQQRLRQQQRRQQQRLRQQQRRQQQHRQQHYQHQSMANTMQIDSSQRTLQHLTEQIVLNNQALIRHQEQQELVLLQQAINYQKQQANLLPSSQLSSSRQLHHHKILQHQMIQQNQHQQHQSNHFHQHGVNNRNTTKPGNNTCNQINDSNISASIDKQTLKIFVENPHLAPLNLDVQDLVKRERKKLRNRIASSKCRKRKLEREGKLEDKVKILREKNIELNAVANALKQQICDLKQRVMEHVNEGCQIIMP